MTTLRRTESRHRVIALAYDGLCTFEFGVAVEIFGLPRPEMGENWYSFAVAAIEEGELRATGGIRVLTEGGLELLATADTIVVPGWRGAQMPVPETLGVPPCGQPANGVAASFRSVPASLCWRQPAC